MMSFGTNQVTVMILKENVKLLKDKEGVRNQTPGRNIPRNSFYAVEQAYWKEGTIIKIHK